MTRNPVAPTLGALLCIGGAPVAAASSSGAWDAFRAEARANCLAAAKDAMERVQIRVDPHGSESYGIALVSGVDRGARTAVSRVRVVAKAKGRAELGDGGIHRQAGGSRRPLHYFA